jgi:hypothetical protein
LRERLRRWEAESEAEEDLVVVQDEKEDSEDSD